MSVCLIGLIVILIFSLCCYSGAFFSISAFKLLYCSGGLWNSLNVADSVTLFILLMLGTCFYYVYGYTHHYFGGDVAGFDLNKIIVLFVSVMASLVVTGDFLTTLIFWEYLGVVSYFLIIFYLSYLSLRASVITLVSSRFGDVCLFFAIALGVFSGFSGVWWGLLFFFIILTKSASFPFISWLLEAMRAPTPVSSLVHSSTLVAAGVWFSMRYDVISYSSNLYGFFICLLITIATTGLCCFFFLDLKKIVALSTCNNIAWCVFYLIYGDLVLSLFQLVSHGVSKCLLFMLVGDVMSGTIGSQSSNCIYSSPLYGPWGIFSLYSIVLGLSGAPFIGVFFTKHILLSGFSTVVNLPMLFFMLFCVFLSYFYSFRLCVILSNVKVSLSSGVYYMCGSGVMVYMWLFLNYFTGTILDEGYIGYSWITFSTLLFQIVSIATAYFLYTSVVGSWWSSSLFGSDNLVEYFFELFNNLRILLSQFYYRWDKECISLLADTAKFWTVHSLSNLINLLMSLLVIILIINCILY
uniref:NADH:ubiquinone reductase (H(+)-translocating) n=2 Tax=Diplogonoporus TaxID=433351 RepID=I0FX29_DIPGA|nr:NADH dehydrogenase subunit 5 [Diplogonoporus balaenopterae]YP_006073384.1 NADH dehydrogenase subunit 5 [Diplogonoporus grandis]BAL73054.1 NADH dehydrogenase subunit 5 [Diplogonoporus balaenopterae]BAL73066.1 NADH dehydrogenase subunit 5 [Diplogonoporus grandis]